MNVLSGLLATLLSALWSGAAPTTAVSAAFDLPSDETVLWAGHEVIRGHKKVPVLGKLETRTETYSLARLRPDPAGFVIEAEACKVTFKKVAGVQVKMDATRLPTSRVKVKSWGDGFVGNGAVRWGRQDVDNDGHPGAAVTVDSTMCGGTLHVSNDSRISMASADASLEGMTGTVKVKVSQSILEAEGRCLSRMAKDESAQSRGRFAYKRVPASSTCESLMRKGWPVKAR